MRSFPKYLAPDAPRHSRRSFLQGSTLSLAACSAIPSLVQSADPPSLTVGLLTDLHYADKPPAGGRHYRETPRKLAEAAGHFARAGVDLVVELGDLIDAADSVAAEQRYLRRINRDFGGICPQRHYVLGNHCVDTLTKAEFLGEVEQERSFYSFDAGPCHFVVLDACFRSDGTAYGRRNFEWTDANIPESELDWLKADLQAATKPVVVFAHQRLDNAGRHAVRNAPQVRQILEGSSAVLAVLQGHSHRNDYQRIGGIHYCTLVAMVEGSGVASNGYSILTVTESANLQLSGFRRQSDYEWTR